MYNSSVCAWCFGEMPSRMSPHGWRISRRGDAVTCSARCRMARSRARTAGYRTIKIGPDEWAQLVEAVANDCKRPDPAAKMSAVEEAAHRVIRWRAKETLTLTPPPECL